MNIYKYLNELRDAISDIPDDKTFTAEEHKRGLSNLIDAIESGLDISEYNYEVQATDSSVRTFDELTVFQKELNDEVIIFQPIAIGEEELSAIDMESLASTLQQLKDNDIIKENILILPPNINVFRAKFKKYY